MPGFFVRIFHSALKAKNSFTFFAPESIVHKMFSPYTFIRHITTLFVFTVAEKRQRNSKDKTGLIMWNNGVNRGNKKAEHSRIALRPGPDQEPVNHNANRSARQDHAKRHNLTGHNSPAWLTKTFFTWSVSDEFAVKCEQFSISRCHFRQHY